MAAGVRILITMVICALWSAPAVPADIAFVGGGKKGDCTIKLAGPIVKGDAEKLKKALAAQRQKGDTINDYPSPVLCLNSPGGDYNEGLLLIDVVSGHDASVRTHVPAGASCDSACALLFLSGRFLLDEESRYPSTPWRSISANAKRLGFHRPDIIDRSKLTNAGVKNDEIVESIISAHGAGVNAVAKLLERSETGNPRQFPQSLLVQALKKKANELFEIDTIDDIGRWNIGLTDFHTPAKIGESSAKQACWNEAMWEGHYSGGPSSAIVSASTGTSAAEVLKKGKAKGADFFILAAYGLEGTEQCLVITKPGKPAELVVALEEFGGSDTFDASYIEQSVAEPGESIETTPFYEQAWQALPPETKIFSLADGRTQTPKTQEPKVAAIDKQPSQAGESKAAKDFVLIENSDLDGDMVGKGDAASMEACAKLCRAKKECKAFTFNIWNSVCFLKGSAAARRLEPSSISGLRQPAGKPSASGDDVVMERYRKKAFPNAPFEIRKVSDEPACYSECEASRKCVAYTFKKENRSCNLLARASEYFADDAADSGVKRQK